MTIVYGAYIDVGRSSGTKVGRVSICEVDIDVGATVGSGNGEGLV